jgi:hypothetical protein
MALYNAANMIGTRNAPVQSRSRDGLAVEGFESFLAALV